MSTAFDLYPAIDLRAGKCVRLMQGDYAAEKVYSDDPVAQAVTFAEQGAPWIHVVDLDAARSGEPVNRDVIAAIADAVPIPVQSGGGVRSAAAAESLLSAGVSRLVIGTAAVSDPTLVERLVEGHPGRIAVGLDARGREVATNGWETASGRDLVELAKYFDNVGVAALVVTEIGRDGTMTGPDVDQLAEVVAVVSVPVIASGGVGSLEDLCTLAELDVGSAGLSGAIVGRAIYEGRFTVAEGVAACSRPG